MKMIWTQMVFLYMAGCSESSNKWWCEEIGGGCITCPDTCESCVSSTECEYKCKSGYWGSNCEYSCDNCDGGCNIEKGCSGNCRPGYYLDQGECHRCENNCMICWTNTNCDNCMTGYVGSECRNFCDGCERDCSPGYFFNDGKCVACPDNCETCLTDTECDKCIDGYWGSLCQYPCSICKDSDCTMCSEVCPDGLYLSSLGQCINCPNNCRKCTDTAVCTECQVGFMGTICQDRICAFNEYFKEYDDNNRCVNCPTNCHSCTDSLNCITCKDGYFGNLCQHNCTGCIDTCEAKTGCTGQCTSGFFKPVSTTHNIFPNANVQFCEKCPNDCKSCISSSECDKCAEGSWGMMCEQFCNSGCSQNKCEDKSGRCLMGCNAGWSGEKCNIRCNTGCVQCDRRNYEICTTCESGYFGELCERTCSSNCKLPSVERASVCTIQSGACLWGCQPTWWGKLCENKCSFFCNSSECNMDDGSCEHGCIDGYTGTFCSREQSLAATGQETGIDGILIGVAAGCGLLFLVTVAGVVIFIMLKRRYRQMKNMSTVSDSPEGWWYSVLCYLLVIGCVEANPGPRKGKKCLSYKKTSQKNKQYMSDYRCRSAMEDDSYSTLDMDSKTTISGIQENPVHAHPSAYEVECSVPPAIKESDKTNILSSTSRQPLQSLTAAERKARSRLKPEVKQREQQADFERKRVTRSCIEEKEKENQSERIWKRTKRAQSAEYRDKERKKQQVAKRKKRSQCTEYRASEKKKDQEAKKKKRSESSEYRDSEKKKDQEAKKKKRSESSEYRDSEKKKDQEAKKKKRSESSEYRDSENKKQQATMAKQRAQSLEYRDKEKKKQQVAKWKKRFQCEEYRDSEKKKEQESKRKKRSQCKKYRDSEKKKEQVAKRKKRSESSEYRDSEKKKDQEAKRRKCSQSKEYRDSEKKKEQVAKRKKRSQCKEYRDSEKKKEQEAKRRKRSQCKEYRDSEKKKEQEAKKKKRSDVIKKLHDDLINLQSKQKQRKNPMYKEIERVKKGESRRRKHTLAKQEYIPAKKVLNEIDTIAEKFRIAIQEGPVHVCSSCKRTLYRHYVKYVPKHRYKDRKKGSMEFVLTGYVSFDGHEYICMTCHRALMCGKVTVQSEYNHLQLDDIPDQLSSLCHLEQRLIAQRLPFMQICNLPKGAQKGIHGPVVNVPSNLDTLVTTLPRLPSDAGLVPVKLKRKLQYKGHSIYQCINPSNVQKGLQFLLDNNALYADIKQRENWLKQCLEMDQDLSEQLFNPFNETREHEQCEPMNEDTDEKTMHQKEPHRSEGKQLDPHEDDQHGKSTEASSTDDSDKDKDEDISKEKLKGLPFNSCLQPSDMVPKRDISTDDIVSLAPGENQKPLSMLTDTFSEVLSFPAQFPTGRFGLKDPDRRHLITPKKYFNQRVLNTDPRFARNIDYLFYSQYFTEMKRLLDSVNIAMRKGTQGSGRKLNAGMMTEDKISELLKQDDGYRFIQNIRGSYPYWERTLTDLNAMVRQLGIPTWFLTLTAADLRWPETYR